MERRAKQSGGPGYLLPGRAQRAGSDLEISLHARFLSPRLRGAIRATK
jgi:hypothetical protein